MGSLALGVRNRCWPSERGWHDISVRRLLPGAVLKSPTGIHGRHGPPLCRKLASTLQQHGDVGPSRKREDVRPAQLFDGAGDELPVGQEAVLLEAASEALHHLAERVVEPFEGDSSLSTTSMLAT